MEKPAEFMQQEPVAGKEDHHSPPYLKDVEMQGSSTEMVQKHGEVNIADAKDTDTTENEQVAASLSGLEKVEAGQEESEKADISNEFTGEKETDDETKEVALNAVPEATDGENYRKGEDIEAMKEMSRTKELSTYSEHNPVLPYFKDSNIEMAHNESPSILEDAQSTSGNIQEQDEEAVEVFDENPTRGTDLRISSGAIDLEIRQQDSTKAIAPPEIDEMKPEYPSMSVDESEGYVCQERNFPESSPLANITPPIQIEEEREESTIQDNHGKDSDNKVAPNDLEDIHASSIIISQKLQDKASEELPAPEKSEGQEEDLIESTGIDTSSNKNTTQVQEESASVIEAERETQAKATVSDLLDVSVKESSETEKYFAGESPIMINIEDVRAIKTENAEDEEKTDKHKDNDKEEEGSAQTREDSGSEGTVIVEVVSRDAAEVKIPHKKHHNILSGVGSKVKHSIAKVKKAITGKSSSQTKPPSPK